MTPLGAAGQPVLGRPGKPPLLPPASVGDFDLLANTSFNDSARVLKNETPFTSTMNEIYDGVLNYYIEGDHLTNHSDMIVRLQTMFADGNSYLVGRDALRQYMCLVLLFRLTGDLRLLDEMVRLAKVAFSDGLRTTWVPGAAILNPSHPWHREPHGKRFFPWLQDTASDHWGHDYHLMDTMRALRTFAPLTLALRQNQAQISPAGHSYEAEADKWEEVMDGFLRVWSKVSDSSFQSNTRVPEIYRGRWTSGGYRRAEADQWPVNFRSLTHPNHSAGALSLYLGRIFDKESVGQAGLLAMYDPFLKNEVLYRNDSTFSGREHAFWGHSMGTWTLDNYYAQPIVYNELTDYDLVDLRLDGALDSYDLKRTLHGLAHSYADWSLIGTSSFGTLLGDIQGDVPRTGASISGRSATIPPQDGRGPYDGKRASHMGHGIVIPWDTTGKMRTLLTAEWMKYWAADGTWATPLLLTVPTGVFMDEAGIA